MPVCNSRVSAWTGAVTETSRTGNQDGPGARDPGTANFSKLEKLEMFNLKKVKCKRT